MYLSVYGLQHSVPPAGSILVSRAAPDRLHGSNWVYNNHNVGSWSKILLYLGREAVISDPAQTGDKWSWPQCHHLIFKQQTRVQENYSQTTNRSLGRNVTPCSLRKGRKAWKCSKWHTWFFFSKKGKIKRRARIVLDLPTEFEKKKGVCVNSLTSGFFCHIPIFIRILHHCCLETEGSIKAMSPPSYLLQHSNAGKQGYPGL